jgi:hypothetical protein
MSGFLTPQRLDSLGGGGGYKRPPSLSSTVGHSFHITNTLRHFLEILNSLLQASPWLSLQVLIHSYSYLNALPQKCLEEKVSHEKWLASASGNGAGRDDKSEEEAKEGADGDDG